MTLLSAEIVVSPSRSWIAADKSSGNRTEHGPIARGWQRKHVLTFYPYLKANPKALDFDRTRFWTLAGSVGAAGGGQDGGRGGSRGGQTCGAAGRGGGARAADAEETAGETRGGGQNRCGPLGLCAPFAR